MTNNEINRRLDMVRASHELGDPRSMDLVKQLMLAILHDGEPRWAIAVMFNAVSVGSHFETSARRALKEMAEEN